MPAPNKIEAVEEMTALFKDATAIYLADFTGLNVPNMTELRKKLFEKDVKFHVAKNRLAKIALKNAGIEGLDDALVGATGFVCATDDVVAPAKVLADFAKVTDGKPALKMGLVDGQLYVAEQVQALAQLPSREELLSKAIGAIQSPITGLVFTLQAILRGLVGTLAAVAEKKQAEEGGA